MKTQKIKKKQKPLLRFLNIFAVVLEIFLIVSVIILAILFVINFLEKRKIEGMTFEEKLKWCLEKGFSTDCETLFIDPERYKDCEKLGELKDKCLYMVALNGRFDLCESIEDIQLKNKCEERTMLSHPTENG